MEGSSLRWARLAVPHSPLTTVTWMECNRRKEQPTHQSSHAEVKQNHEKNFRGYERHEQPSQQYTDAESHRTDGEEAGEEGFGPPIIPSHISMLVMNGRQRDEAC